MCIVLLKRRLVALVVGLLIFGVFRVADAVSREQCYGGAILNDRGAWVNPDRERLERGDDTCSRMD